MPPNYDKYAAEALARLPKLNEYELFAMVLSRDAGVYRIELVYLSSYLLDDSFESLESFEFPTITEQSRMLGTLLRLIGTYEPVRRNVYAFRITEWSLHDDRTN